MLTRLLGLDETGQITGLQWYFRTPGGLLVVLLIAAAVAYVVLLYRKEWTLSLRRKVFLGALRALLYVIVILLLFQPTLGVDMQVRLRRDVLVLVDVSGSMDRPAHDRTDPKDIEAVAKAMDKLPLDGSGISLSESARQEAAGVKRLDLARAILQSRQLDLPGKLGEGYNLRYFTFGENARPVAGKGPGVPEGIRAARSEDKMTCLGTAISDAVAGSAGQPIAGVIVLTDGASNHGLEPLEVARRMKEQTVPLYPVGLGSPSPPDVRLKEAIVADTVFVNDRVPVRVQVQSSGFAGQGADLTVTLSGRDMATRHVVLDDRPQYVELYIEPKEKADSAGLEVAISRLPGEASTDNNTVTRTVRVIDEKIKVIYVEGKPRWEYRYLRRVLLRDHRLDVKFLLTEGDRDLARQSDVYIADFPVEANKAFEYDLVILGDVPSGYFSRAQLARIEELVGKRQGSLLLLAGFEHAPASYIGTPLEPLLPVKLLPEGWRKVDDTVCPRVTDDGYRSSLAVLDVPEDKNQALWALVKPMYKLPAIEPKGGATVLVDLSSPLLGQDKYPLISWQRYGSGKTMLVATDQLWRLRFKRGDKFHARLWGQTIQFLTLSRLLGGNKLVHLQSPRGEYLQGEPVAVTADVLDESYEPRRDPAYEVVIVLPDGTRKGLTLQPAPNMPGMFQGYFNPAAPGRYEVKTDKVEPKLANTLGFEVKSATLEDLEPAMQETTLRKLAEISGGKYFTLAQLPELPRTIAGEMRTSLEHKEKELWDLAAVFVVLLLLAGTEWFFRRKYDLI